MVNENGGITMSAWAWHIHHDRLLEPLREPIEARRACIRERKPPKERKLRLRLLHEVRGSLPAALDQAWEAYHQAEKPFDEAAEAYHQAIREIMPTILELHAAECPDCPWDGVTILGKEKEA